VEANRDTQVARLTRAGFDRSSKAPPLGSAGHRSKLAMRLSTDNCRNRTRFDAVSTIALVPARPGAPVAAFCGGPESGRLEKYVPSFTVPALLSTPNSAALASPRPGARSGNLRPHRMARRLEMAHSFVITRPTRVFPLDRALYPSGDQNLVVAMASTPEPGEIETVLLARPAPHQAGVTTG